MDQTEITQRTLDATMYLFRRREVVGMSIDRIAEEAGISAYDILSVYPNLKEIITTLSLCTIHQFEQETQAIALESGREALSKLINRHIYIFFGVELNRSNVPPDAISDHVISFKNFQAYFNEFMPKLYVSFFERNRDLIPDTDMDLKYYAYFIAHSMNFFKRDILSTYTKDVEERKAITRDIISSLFGIEELELN